MPDIEDGESIEVQGSAKDPYILKNTGGVYSCTCPAWRTQSLPIEKRTCKHLRKYRGDEAETSRLGGELPAKSASSKRTPKSKDQDDRGAEVAQASDAPGFLLAHSWDNELDLTGWWMSEKLDGVRAYWDGKRFISRQGNVFHAPEWFIEDLPGDVHLDGELWIERKAFQRTVSIVRRQDKTKDWEMVRFIVFDAPKVDDVFEARLGFLQQYLDESQPRYAAPHVQERCQSVQHLLEELKRVEDFGGEGLMLRQPNSRYEAGRSATLLKVKTFHDAEAKVLEHLPGTGKHQGRLGALSVELKDGTRFNIGTGFSDKERENPPAIGSIVTFRYQELTDRGVPRFPSFVSHRPDLDAIPDSSGDDISRLVNEIIVSKDAGKAAKESRQSFSGTPTENSTTSPLPKKSHNVAQSDEPDQSGDGITSGDQPSNVISFAPRGAAPAMASRDASTPRYFEFVEGGSSKFWSIWRSSNDVSVRYGRIGTDGQEKTKSFDSGEEAHSYYEKIIDEKVAKGYSEKSEFADSRDDEDEIEDCAPDDSGESSANGVASFADYAGSNPLDPGRYKCFCSQCEPSFSASGSSHVHDTAIDAAGMSYDSEANSIVTANLLRPRTFRFVEGNSSKFWSISLDGCQVTVNFGRIGTKGREQIKAFPSSDKAKRYYDEIIDEKVEKGYKEE